MELARRRAERAEGRAHLRKERHVPRRPALGQLLSGGRGVASSQRGNALQRGDQRRRREEAPRPEPAGYI